MSQRETTDEHQAHYRAYKYSRHGIALRVGTVFEGIRSHKRQTFRACLMDERLNFMHHKNRKFRAAKKLAKAWVK